MASSGVEVRFTVVLSAWFVAAAHTSRIRAITGGTARKQLTRGHWWQLEHHAEPCCCTYYVVATDTGYVVMPTPEGYTFDGMQATHLVDLHGCLVASLFRIKPECPAHGHLRNAHVQARLMRMHYPDGYDLRDLYDLDDDEAVRRRNAAAYPPLACGLTDDECMATICTACG